MVGHAVDQRVNRAQFQEAARFKSKDGCQPVAGHANLSLGVQQQHAGFDGIEQAGHFRFQALFRFAQRLLRALILHLNEPPRPISSRSSDRASQVHANDAATIERRLEGSRGSLILLERRGSRRMNRLRHSVDRIARHGRKQFLKERSFHPAPGRKQKHGSGPAGFQNLSLSVESDQAFTTVLDDLSQVSLYAVRSSARPRDPAPWRPATRRIPAWKNPRRNPPIAKVPPSELRGVTPRTSMGTATTRSRRMGGKSVETPQRFASASPGISDSRPSVRTLRQSCERFS